jgi:hypothetical protein
MTRKLIRAKSGLLLLTVLALVMICGDFPSVSAASAPSDGAQVPDFGDGGKADDAVRRAILSGPEIPRTIFDVHRQLERLGGTLKTHIVANRGYENPQLRSVSFSFFQTYSGPMKGGQVEEGELFIGFFAGADGDVLTVDQNFSDGSLMIELIAWDRTKEVYNFWELIGNGVGSDWHFRGDSNDILADVARINVGASSPAFGNRLRCSGCHSSGGPIMKELEAPQNDWWTTQRKLFLGPFKLKLGTEPNSPTNTAARLFEQATDASHLSQRVKNGIDRLTTTRAQRGGDRQTLRQQLRSLFSTMEMNLVTDSLPFKEREQAGALVEIPQAFFVDARLTGKERSIPVELSLYKKALKQVGSRFAPDETAGLVEAFHAFVVPARSHVDNQVIDSLMKRGLLDVELVADILAVDFTTPVYSRARASLVRFVPETASDAIELRDKFITSLRQTPQDPAARQLLENLTDPARNAEFHRKEALAYLENVSQASLDFRTLVDWLKIASQRRLEIAKAETSLSRRGKILEPGFRVIFPIDSLHPVPSQLRLDPSTGRAIAVL